ncbi:3-beta hydroxysteroid dehydrogenase/isomerase family protein [Rhizoctonia solani AG-3 Rhs1AP]|uniref:3-beta hydroxysteroid dehydrogenase/isomerase family protein n=1 Tax=Rhizoctonia solani AG-3 Rhs1AP TaxID=1086054 RepID=X8J5X4_9AGAM|nr:3-beta hydroxysteroid dehydrogenase/isomerase family protein [Rhizoctonia solani AG-3 Rhs1AP]
MAFWIILGAIALVGSYLFILNKRLTTPDPSVLIRRAVFMSDDELAKVTVPTPQDMAEAMKAHGPTTGKAYSVIGGSGLVGQYIVRTLLARGETLVRIIDFTEPKVSGDSDVGAIDSLFRAEFVRADVPDYISVVIHTVAAIRNFERLAYVKHLSYQVNVHGTRNIIKACQELGTVDALVYTSSAAVLVRPSKYLWLGLFGTRPGAVVGDDTQEDIPRLTNHYISTKIEGEKLVRATNGGKGISTGILRPEMCVQRGCLFLHLQ